MSKRSKIGQLARALYCSPKQAKDFAAEVNRQINLRGHNSVSFDRICHVLQMGNGRSLSATEVAYHFIGTKPARSNTRDRYKGQEVTVSSIITNGESPDETAIPLEHFEEAAVVDSLTETHDNSLEPNLSGDNLPWQILSTLTDQHPSHVTYGQIEAALLNAGLDPFQAEDEYLWLIEQLEVQNILVIEKLVDLSNTDLDEEAEAESNAKEVRQILERIHGRISEEDNILLTAEEQRRLVEIVRNGERTKRELRSSEGQTNHNASDALNKQIAHGDSALETLLVRNRRLVASLVLKHGKGARHLEFDDLYQEGMLGLWRAIKGFDLEMNTGLSTYATYWIRQAISRAIADQEQTIRVPVHRFDKINRLRVATNELTSELERVPNELEIAERLNLISSHLLGQIQATIENGESLSLDINYQVDQAVKQVRKLQQYANMQPVSLDQPVGMNEEESLGEFIPDTKTDSVEEIVEKRILQYEIARILQSLTERQRYVIISRFGLGYSEEMTLEAIGQNLNLTRERIRQIQAKVIRKLQHLL